MAIRDQHKIAEITELRKQVSDGSKISHMGSATPEFVINTYYLATFC